MSRATGRLIRPCRTVPRITGTNSARGVSSTRTSLQASRHVIEATPWSSGCTGSAGPVLRPEPTRPAEHARAGGDERAEHADDPQGQTQTGHVGGEPDQRWPGEEPEVAGGRDRRE